MRKYLSRLCVVMSILVAIILSSGCSMIGGPNLEKITFNEERTSLLKGRLSVQLPKGTSIQPMPANPLAIPLPEEEESRAIIQIGKKIRFVVIAEELFTVADDKFFETIKKQVNDKNRESKNTFVTKKMVLTNGLEVIQITPSKLIPARTAVSSATAYVVKKDKTIQQIRIFGNAPVIEQPAGCALIADSILKSLMPGTRDLNLAKGKRKLYAYSETRALTISLPDNYATTMQRGPDFLIHRIREISKFGKPTGGDIGIYLGSTPKLHHLNASKAAFNLRKIDSKMLNEDIMWYKLSPAITGIGSRHSAETIVPINRLNLYLHIFFSANTAKELNKLKKIIETLTMTP
jgi:hypothetical protein